MIKPAQHLGRDFVWECANLELQKAGSGKIIVETWLGSPLTETREAAVAVDTLFDGGIEKVKAMEKGMKAKQTKAMKKGMKAKQTKAMKKGMKAKKANQTTAMKKGMKGKQTKDMKKGMKAKKAIEK